MTNKIPVGLQLYTVRDETSKDFVGVLEKVAKMGYATVEFAGYGGIEAKQMKNILDDLGLQAASSHVGIQLLSADLPKEIAYVLEIGAKYIVCPYLAAEQLSKEDSLQEIIQSLQRIGAECNRNGVSLLFHNHASEFQKLDGQYVLDRMYQEIDASLLGAELDLFWVKKGGEDPEAYLRKYAGRTPIVHVKDMADDAEGSFTEVGSGIMDYPSILATAKAAGVQHFIVEQDAPQMPSLDSARMSLEYLKSIGIV